MVKIHFILLNPGLKSAEQDWGPSDQAAEQSYFLKEEFHYLDVTQIRKFTIFDMFHCTLACLRNNLCLSLNMASSRGTEGKLWCELLSEFASFFHSAGKNTLTIALNSSTRHLQEKVFKRTVLDKACLFTAIASTVQVFTAWS